MIATFMLAAALALLPGGDRFGYDLQILTSPTGRSSAYGLSGTGITAGNYVEGGAIVACIWIDGALEPVGSTANPSVAYAVNQDGLAVGWESIGGNLHPFRYFGLTGTFELLPGVVGGLGQANDVNAGGMVVGISPSAGPKPQRAVVWDRGGVVTDLGTLGGIKSFAAAINDRGVIVGNAQTVSMSTRPFAYSSGVMRELRILSGDFEGVAVDVNEDGLIVGTSRGFINGSGKGTAVAWTRGQVHALPLGPSKSSEAVAVNDRGHVVGHIRDGGYYGPVIGSFLLADGVVHRISQLAATPDGWTLSTVADIDDDGRICGNGSDEHGTTFGYVLTPKAANLDRDWDLDRADVALFRAAFLQSGEAADMNRDRVVDGEDLQAFLAALLGS